MNLYRSDAFSIVLAIVNPAIIYIYKLTNLQITYIMDTSIIILTLVFLAMFIVPFCVIGLMNRHKENEHDQENARTESVETDKSGK